MKQKLRLVPASRQRRDNRFPNFHFRTGWKVMIALFFFSANVTAQESTPEEFPVGAILTTKTEPAYYDSFALIGLNMMMHNTTDETETYTLLANNSGPAEWISHYSSAFYSKWEADENQLDTNKVGVKHKFGSKRNFQGRECWSTEGLSAPADSLIYGPHYHQEKLYKRWYGPGFPREVKYIPRFSMALTNPDSVPGSQDVCRLSVWVRHAPIINGVWNDTVYDHILKGPITLKVSDFPQDSSFKYFYLDDDTLWYQYPDSYGGGSYILQRELPVLAETVWVDIFGNNGVEFRVDWLRNDNKCNLYIDNMEVYDNDGGQHFTDSIGMGLITSRIQTYTQNHSQWTNIKYWIGHDEPSSIDCYTPIYIVDSLIRSVQAPSLMIHFDPSWTWDHKINGEDQMAQYISKVNPEKFLFEYPKSDLIRKRYLILQDLK